MSGYLVYAARKANDLMPESLSETLGRPKTSLTFTVASSLVTMLITIAGAASVYRKNISALYVVSLIFAFISIIEISSGIYMKNLSSGIEQDVILALKIAIEYYGVVKSTVMDDLQVSSSCCGVMAPEVDWLPYATQNNNSFPISCCNGTSVGSLCLSVTKPPCIPKVTIDLQGDIKSISNVAIFEPLGQVINVVASLFLIQCYSAKP